MIAESLARRRIAITGSTGFLGTALVERLLRTVPDCELVIIVRPGRRGAERRVSFAIISPYAAWSFSPTLKCRYLTNEGSKCAGPSHGTLNRLPSTLSRTTGILSRS